MPENFVGKEEFNILVKRVDKMELQNEKNEELLREVDKKVDVILEKLTNVNNSEDLKLAPIIKRIDDLEDSKKWLWRAIREYGHRFGNKILDWIGGKKYEKE